MSFDHDPSPSEAREYDERYVQAAAAEEHVAPTVRGQRVVWAPQPGSQTDFLSCPIFECLYHGTRGPGKGLPLDEPVFTPMGEIPIGRLHVGSWVLCPDGTRSKVIGVYPQGVRPVYEIEFDDGAIARCDDAHIWAVHVQGHRTKRQYTHRLMVMEEVLRRYRAGQRIHIPTIEHAVKTMDPPRLRRWPIEPYMLGLLLGDGCFTQGRTLYCTVDDELADHAVAHGFQEAPPYPGRTVRSFSNRKMSREVKRLGLAELTSGDKHVPAIYLGASPVVRLSMLQGLMDTDGTVDKSGYVSFCSKSEQLAKDVQYLVRSLGGKAKLTQKDLGTYGIAHNVYVQCAGKFEPFRLPRKAARVRGYQHEHLRRRIVSIREVEPAETVCIRIDHPLGLFVTRDFVVTHNTDALLWSFAQHVGRGFGAAWRGVLFRQTYPQLADVVAKSEKWFRQIFPGARFNRSRMAWEWPTGEMLLFRHMARPEDYWSYHGHEFPWIGWEELTNWADDRCYTSMFACCRSSRPGLPRMVRATTNPYGPGHNWIKARFRLYGRWWETIVTLDATDNEGRPEPPRCAIHGHIDENQILLAADPDYKRTIIAAASNPAMAEAWLSGSWDIVAGGMFDDVWNPRCNVVPRFEVPRAWRLDRAFDWGSSKPFSVGWWAESDGSDVDIPGRGVVSTVRGDLFRIAEWYGWNGRPNEGLRMLAVDVAAGIVEREIAMGLDGRVKPGPADSSIYDVENGVSIALDMAKPIRIGANVHRGVSWTRADKRPGSRKTGWEVMRKLMRAARRQPGRPRENEGLFVLEHCEQFLRTVPSAPRSERDPDDVDTDSEDHVIDEARYRCRAVGNRAGAGRTTGLY